MHAEKNKQQSSNRDHRKPTKPWLAVLMGVSVLASCTVLIWMFTLPLRQTGLLKATPAKLDATKLESSAAGRNSVDDPDEVRERAFLQHQDFLYTLKRNRKLKEDKRQFDPKDAEEVRQQRREIQEAEIERLNRVIVETDAPEGSMFQKDRELLIKVNEDMGT